MRFVIYLFSLSLGLSSHYNLSEDWPSFAVFQGPHRAPHFQSNVAASWPLYAQAPSPTPSPSGSPSPAPASSPAPTTELLLAKPVQSMATKMAAIVTNFIASRPALTAEKIKAAEYYFLAKGPIKLVNGKYEDPATKRSYELSDVMAYGDLNQDGFKDAVTALKVTIPNSGNFAYLVSMVNILGEPKNISTEFLGAQTTVKSLTIKPDTSIEAVLGQYQPGDPACCPRLEIKRTYKFREQQPADPKASPAPGK